MKNTPCKRASAIFLVLVFLAAWSLKSVHEFFRHHSDHPVCTATVKGGGKHLHDERYIGDNCSLCAFVLFVPELLSITTLVAPANRPPDSLPPDFYQAPFDAKTAFDTTLRRGPPVI